MKSAGEIAELAKQQKLAAGPLHARRIQVRDLYGGDLTVPLPELHENEAASVANMVQQAIDGTSQRTASTVAHIEWAPVRPGFKQHEENARRKRQVSLCWWEKSAMDLIDLKRARHLIAYGESPIEIRWDRNYNIPCWHVRDPLDAYAAPIPRVGDMEPPWQLYCYTRTLGWVRQNYPVAYYALNVGAEKKDAIVVDIVEYLDAEETVLVAVGKKPETWEDHTITNAVELERVPNLIGRATSVLPGRLGLANDRRGQVDGMVAKYMRRARLDALQHIAIEEGVFPKQWLVGRQGETPKIIQVADPRKGVVGIVQGGVLDTVQLNPGYKTDQALRDLERAEMIEGNIPASFLGEGISGARTGRLSDSIESASVDFGIAEAQKILARSKKIELEIAAELAKAYAGNVTVSLYVGGKNSGAINYKADELFDTIDVSVTYPMPGADYNQQIVRTGQKLAVKLISRQTAREMDPEVADPELERDRTTAEALEDALLTSIQTLASQPDGPWTSDQLARLAELVVTNKKELFDAVTQVKEEAQKAQAAAPPETPAGMAAAPETMPGLAAPSQPQPQQGPPPLEQLLGQLGGGQAAPPVPAGQAA